MEIPEYAIKELDRARESLLAAKLLLENDLFADCVSRSYYLFYIQRKQLYI